VSLGLAGRAIAGVGVVAGLLGIALTIVSFPGGFSARHVQDGTAAAFLLITLAFASHFPAEIGRDAQGAALGAAAFGFYLFVPARFAFDQLDVLDAGAWLGFCSVLIPLGFLVVQWDRAHAAATQRTGRTLASLDPGPLAALVGLALIVVGVWLAIDDGGPSYWNLSHTLGILVLLLAAANLLYLWRGVSDTGLLVASATFGLVVYAWVYHAFERLGSLGSGGWLEAVGGLVLIAGVLYARRTAAVPAAAGAPSPLAAQ
jgi:hypothetical protein